MIDLPSISELIGSMYDFGNAFFSGNLKWIWFFIGISVVGIILQRILQYFEDKSYELGEFEYEKDMSDWLVDRYGEKQGEAFTHSFISARHMPDTRDYGLGYFRQAPVVQQPFFPQFAYQQPRTFSQVQYKQPGEYHWDDKPVEKKYGIKEKLTIPGTGRILTMRNGQWVDE